MTTAPRTTRNTTRPAVQLTLVDAGHLYLSWRWEHDPHAQRVLVLPRDEVRGPLDELAAAVPSPLAGESGEQALERSLGHGPLVDRSRETGLAERLAAGLFPARLAAELTAVCGDGVRPHLRVQPSPSTAQVPWEALLVDPGTRLVDHVDVSVLVPATVRNARERCVSPWRAGGPVVGVLDPVVPGFDSASALGSVLGPGAADSALAGMLTRLGSRLAPTGARALRPDNVDRDVLERALADASRLLYVGHVTRGGHGLDVRLHLCCGPGTTGLAPLVGAHRPLTAADIVLGHRPDTRQPWRIPNRVALIACESGSDARFAEPAGLVTAMVHGGAEYVTATRWVLPTDAGLARYLPGIDGAVLADTVVAVNDTHESADPVAALGTWQRDMATRWARTGEPACSPLLWAAFSTAYAPAPAITGRTCDR